MFLIESAALLNLLCDAKTLLDDAIVKTGGFDDSTNGAVMEHFDSKALQIMVYGDRKHSRLLFWIIVKIQLSL